jgi:hypothetical protein
MVAIGIVLLLGGYGLGLNGYSLIRGYDMTFGSFWNPVHPGTWNTQLYTGSSVFPDGKTQGTRPAQNPPGAAKPGVPLTPKQIATEVPLF